MELAELFSDEDYRFQMRLQRGRAGDFFARTPDHLRLADERRHWLRVHSADYAAWLPGCEPLLAETVDLLREWKVLSDDDEQRLAAAVSPEERCSALGEVLETDFLLLSADEHKQFRLLGGCVCFPSSWALAEKIGRSMEFIHGAVPGLNAEIGNSIQAFLAKLGPGAAWHRQNWGLSRTPDLNHHPRRCLPKLDASIRLDEVWLRVEHQALVGLPASHGVLFGIRIAIHPLSEVRDNPAAARNLHRALLSMPEAVAVYKGLSAARAALLKMLAP